MTHKHQQYLNGVLIHKRVPYNGALFYFFVTTYTHLTYIILNPYLLNHLIVHDSQTSTIFEWCTDSQKSTI